MPVPLFENLFDLDLTADDTEVVPPEDLAAGWELWEQWEVCARLGRIFSHGGYEIGPISQISQIKLVAHYV